VQANGDVNEGHCEHGDRDEEEQGYVEESEKFHGHGILIGGQDE